MTLNKFLHQYIRFFVIFTFFITSLYAENISSKIIFGVEKNEIALANNLSFVKNLFEKNIKAQELQAKCDFDFNLVSYGEYGTIELSPIKTLKDRQSIILLLKPHFPDLFVINNNADRQNKKIHKVHIDPHPKQITVDIELLEKLKYENKVDHALDIQNWLNKWYALIVILLLGGFFSYRRSNQLKRMNEQQKILSREQDTVETQLKK